MHFRVVLVVARRGQSRAIAIIGINRKEWDEYRMWCML